MRSIAATSSDPGKKCAPVGFKVQIPSNARDLLVGQTLHGISGHFYVLSVLGMGGMSVVYKAKNLENKRIIAVKTLRMQALADDMAIKRFKREAQTLTYLNHPNIIRIYDFGNSRKGQPFFVMEFLTGKSLSQILKEDDVLTPDRALRIFYKVLDAVEQAHGQGLIHRDLKPGNIMLIRRRDGSDAIKVVDFGIARFEEEAQRLTRMGEVWGSPIYMSPEQCMGTQLDARSDIYSLGIVMYEALTGEVPFLGKNYVETMSKQINEPPPPFKTARPDLTIPQSLEKIVMKALNKEPDRRYQIVSDMKKDVADALADSEPPRQHQSFGKAAPAHDDAKTDSEASRTGATRSSSRLRSYSGGELPKRGRSASFDRYQETPSLGSLVVKVVVFALLIGLGLGIIVSGVRFFQEVEKVKQKNNAVNKGQNNSHSSESKEPVPF